MVILKICIVVFSIIFSLIMAEYQWCYRNEEAFSVSRLCENLKKMPGRYMIFGLIYLSFSVVCILFYKQKNVSLIQLPQFVFFWECALMCAWIDFKVKKIPNSILLLMLFVRCCGFVVTLFFTPEDIIAVFINSMIGMLVGAAFVLICRLISRGGIGAGDVKLFALIGLYFGSIALINIMFYALFFAALASAILLISKRAGFKSTLALGPFVFIGLNIYYILL